MNPFDKNASKQKTGQHAEQLASDYLQKQGLKCITRNYRCRLGEIDLIMRDRHHLIFVEVRFRRHTTYGSSSESVNRAKQMRLLHAADYYLQQQQLTESTPCRFDVVAITHEQTLPTIEWIKNAFTR